MPHREINIDCAGLFPAKAGPTGTQSVPDGFTTRSVGNDQIKSFPAKAGPTKSMRGVSGTGGDPRKTGFSREALDLLLIFIRK